ncbi:hypothetical protein [Kitasatospora sp. MBT66]|uniref:hypothetical protein n=1 Tax=Kitasatospora sp. MBT66 TaxID=1444769 RepID=UPI0005B97DA8|nr:hypothetical protein [Kitasatospora sp. MBT66]
MPNQLKVYDGSKWVDQTPKAWNGASWASSPPLYWDGAAWMSAAPAPKEFPAYQASTRALVVDQPLAELALPPVRTNDFIVSICVSSGSAPAPRLVTPAGAIPTQYTLASGLLVAVAVWPWEPSRGSSVVWDVGTAHNAVLMNLAYRSGDISNIGLTPVVGIREYTKTNSLPLMASTSYRNLYAAVTVSGSLTGLAWPSGVAARDQQLGTFGTNQISLMVADTPGAGGSPGAVQLDTTVASAAVVLISVPGRSDGKATWILGDSVGSELGTTTILEP